MNGKDKSLTLDNVPPLSIVCSGVVCFYLLTSQALLQGTNYLSLKSHFV